MWKRFLKPTGKPVVSLDLPMCGDADYTPGLDATVSIQRQDYFNRVLEHAYASCKTTCQAVTFSGFAGSDLFNFWVKASQRAATLHPNVKVIQDYPAQFDPQLGRQKMQDALQAHPTINLVVSHDDAMSKGVSAAIKAAGKQPGKDVAIYSNGAGKVGLPAIRSGEFNETTMELPYEESYHAATALVMAMEGKPVKGYINEEQLPRVTDGPGTIYITKKNADSFTPNW
jgi:ABC-type sugar transport system substrate-binding protein